MDMSTLSADVIAQYDMKGKLISVTPLGNGHINDTFLLEFNTPDTDAQRLVLQRINTDVFHEPEKLMKNITGITSHIARKVREQGGDLSREVLFFLRTAEGKPFAEDERGDYWRISRFIEDAVSYEQIESPELFYQGALAFGRFQQMLSDYPAETLYETITGFHDTQARYRGFLKAVQEDVAGRGAKVQDEIGFVIAHRELANAYSEAEKTGEIPLRVTHNDTKLNNIMLDKKTGRGLCVLDLDTVMPGYVMNDFGDAIRSGTNTAAEDDADRTRVSCDLELYEAFAKGFLEVLGSELTGQELRLLPTGAKVMTYELVIRFLTDYLHGDTYFKTAYDEQNLCRARNQIWLLTDMERKQDQMQMIVGKYARNYRKQVTVQYGPKH